MQWITLTFDLAFRWAKIRSKYRLKSKSKVALLSESLRPKFRSKYILRPKLSRTNWLKSVEFAWKRYLKSLYFLTFAQRKSQSKVKLNFGLSPDFCIQLKVSLSKSLSERLSQKLRWPSVMWCSVIAVGMTVAVQTDTHYAILSLLLLLSNSPTNATYQQPTPDKFPGIIISAQQSSVSYTVPLSNCSLISLVQLLHTILSYQLIKYNVIFRLLLVNTVFLWRKLLSAELSEKF